MTLRRTAFHGRTAALGASFVEYADYEFPSRYAADILDEYWACRQRAVVIDLTPLRKVELAGPGAEAMLQATITRDVTRLADGGVAYTALCDDDGNVVDDGTVFRFGPQQFRWIGYTDDDEDWFRSHAERLGAEVSFENSTNRLHNIAVQGPKSRDMLRPIVRPAPGRPAFDDLTWFTFTEGRLGSDGPEVLVSRTGYSGELGYEVWCHPDDGEAVWDAIWVAGRDAGVAALGLDALDILRIESGLIFKGYEYEGTEDPFEAGIGFTAPKKKADYVGQAALERRRENPARALVGLEIDAAAPFAHGDKVQAGGAPVGVVTSGSLSPLLNKNLALARVGVSRSALGERLEVVGAEGGETALATVVRFPFYDPDKTRPRS